MKRKHAKTVRIHCKFCGAGFTIKVGTAYAPHHYTHQAVLCGGGGITLRWKP